jgi:hypothetical protein
MNDENRENEASKSPVILTIPASLTVPGFGFLVALNPDWRFEESIAMTNLRERGVAKKADRFQESLMALGPGSPDRRLRGRAPATASNLALTLCGFRKCGIKGPNITRNRPEKKDFSMLALQLPQCVTFEVNHSPTPGRSFPHTTDHGYVVPVSRLSPLPRARFMSAL